MSSARSTYQTDIRSGRGFTYHVRRGVTRALTALGEATTREIMTWTHPRKIWDQPRRLPRERNNAARSIRRAADRIAVRVRKLPPGFGGWV